MQAGWPFRCTFAGANQAHGPTGNMERVTDHGPMSLNAQQTILHRRWYLFILLALAVKGLYIAIQVQELKHDEVPGMFSVETGDTRGYLEPVEKVLAGGNYDPDYRMPGVGASYWLFRQFLDQGSSRDAQVVLQWCLSGLNVYLLALLAWRMSGSERTALAVYGAFLLSANSSWFDSNIASDSLAISTLIIQSHLLQRAFDTGERWALLLSGLMLAWFTFLRPVGAALFMPAVLLIFFFARPTRSLKPVMLFILPFLIVDGAWTIRNWRVNKEFSPLTNQGLLPEEFTSELRGHAMHFIQGYGGNYIWWAPGSDIRWYGLGKGGAHLDDEGRLAAPPPDHAFVQGYTMDSLVRVGQRIRNLDNGLLSPSDSLNEVLAINATLDRYASLYKEGAPFHYHITSRLLMLKNVMWQHGGEGLILRPFSVLPWWLQVFKVLQVVCYVFAYTIGTVAMIRFLWRSRNAPSALHLWVPWVAAFLVLVYPVALRMCEWRYMTHPFPFALMMGILLIGELMDSRRGATAQT